MKIYSLVRTLVIIASTHSTGKIQQPNQTFYSPELTRLGLMQWTAEMLNQTTFGFTDKELEIMQIMGFNFVEVKEKGMFKHIGFHELAIVQRLLKTVTELEKN